MVTGSGTSGDPFVLSTFAELELIGSSTTYSLAKYYKLGADIDASPTQDPGYNGGAGWLPRGTSSVAFTGGFDGNGYAISGLYINRPTSNEIGLFGRARGIINNVLLTKSGGNGSITGQNYVGGVVGYYYDGGTLTNNTVEIDVTGVIYVGGIFGGTRNATSVHTVTGNVFNGTVTGTTNYVGGIAGRNIMYHASSTMNHNTVNGNVVGGGNYIGGICGYIRRDCSYNVVSSEATITSAPTSDYVGGIFGSNDYTITAHYNECYADVSGQDYVGGVFGYASNSNNATDYINYNVVHANISGRNYVGGCGGLFGPYGSASELYYNEYEGTVTGTGESIGGLAGSARMNIMNTTIDGDKVTIVASATSDYVGGIIGKIHDYGTVITNCHSTADISARDYVGGLIGGTNGAQFFNLIITKCHTECNVNGRNHVGGFAGYLRFYQVNCKTEQCYSSGTVVATGNLVGGFVGYCETYAVDCYSDCDVEGVDQVGGFAGLQYYFNMVRCYSRGLVVGSSLVGGLAGDSLDTSATNCYWDTETSGQATSALGTGKTTEEMLDQDTYVDWDFATPIWKMMPCSNMGYPHLKDVPTVCVIFNLGGLDSSFQFGCDLA